MENNKPVNNLRIPKKISIITPVKNGALTIADAIESVLSQTYQNVEHIIVDGGSTDDTVKIARRYELLYPNRITILEGQDSGIYEGNNRGLRYATGDVIGILNCDDYFSQNDVLSTIVDRLTVTEADAVYGDVRYVRRHNKRHTVRYYSSAIFKPRKMLRGFMPAHPTFYCYRDIYEEFGLYDESFQISGDFEIMLRMIYKGGIKIHYIAKEFVTMRWGGASTKWSNVAAILREHKRAYQKNDVRTTMIADASRYFYKIREFLHFI